ncbi:MAG: hypothetical protein Q8P67_09975 [archaeon]|nr:hypothetical protein [archaeon]
MAAGVAGKYEYLTPGTKELQTLDLNADGTAVWTEKGETGIEKYESTGRGRWKVEAGVCQVLLDKVTKTMEFKIKTMVPGIEDGTSYRENVSIPIMVPELVNAKEFGTNKWRKRK